ncbi:MULTISPECIES: hypothetical protein [unclassified Saccharibacter]|nr:MULTISPECIES: hypothetical protein [unclassified Saccharibacter]MXV65809.1 hypothetical protein [Saccharibacter sp. EH60]MXV35738.1 hypothetical protein [Saccharibacter sp. EH611]MXV35740.1 hypothetical protein [Saccharibacter sp. EH611]MXV58351.1 hypothetical protein [Saccharibacter sp. EH70]MXV58365.1 hypothetical protein [Saccharibacter sp. EH70]
MNTLSSFVGYPAYVTRWTIGRVSLRAVLAGMFLRLSVSLLRPHFTKKTRNDVSDAGTYALNQILLELYHQRKS